MKNLFCYTVIGLISLSSLPALSISAETGDSGKNAQEAPQNNQVFVPPGTIAPVIDTSQEIGKTPPGGEGNDPKKIVEPIKTWRTAVATCPAAQKSAEGLLADIDRNAKKYQDAQEACKTREDKANTFCMESRNPDIKNFISIAQVLTAGLSGMMDACSKFGKVMDVGNKALTSYQALCSSWRGYCNSACGDAVNGVKAIQAKKKELVNTVVKVATAEAEKGATNPNAINCMAVAKSYAQTVQNNDEAINEELKVGGDYKAVAQKYETCKGYGKELATAALGGLSMLKSLATANKCEDDTKSSSTAAATPTPVDCTKPENKQNNMTCICQDAPRTPGCNNGLDSATVAKNGDALRAASSGSYTPGTTTGGNAGIDGGTGDGMDLSSKSPDGGGSSAPGAPMGGGGGLGGSGGGFGGGPGGAEGKKASGLNTNILGGEGGGGGGGSWGGYGSDRDPALRQYLPGGAKDPAAGMAGAAVSKQVTSQGGKSNWEKIKERYRDNKPSLLGY